MPDCTCKTCEKIFYVRPSWFKKGIGKYCSLPCRNIGYKTSLKGKNNSFYGKKHSQETKDKMSKKKKGKPCNFIKTKFKKGDIRITGKNNPNWKNGRHKHSRGYILVLKPNHPFAYKGYMLEHRLVVEAQIGRYLTPEEVTHHLGKRDNNRPHMLMAFISQSAHKRFERKGNIKPSEIIFDGRKI